MSLILKWSTKALEDIRGIHERLSESSGLNIANRTVDKIHETIDLILQFPGMGKKGRIPGSKEFVIAHTPFIVVYDPKGGAIEIVRVWDGRKNLDRGFEIRIRIQ